MSKPGRIKILSLVGAVVLAASVGCAKGSGEDKSADGGKEDQQKFTTGKYFDYLFYLDRAEDGAVKLQRWNGDPDAKPETLVEGEGLMYETLNVSKYGNFVSWVEKRGGGTKLMVHYVESGKTKETLDYPVDDDVCVTPTWAADGRGQLLVPADDFKTVRSYDVPSTSKSDPKPIAGCDPLQAAGEGDAPDIFYWNAERGDVEFVTPQGEVAKTGVGAAVEKELGTDVHGLYAVSMDGSEVCLRLKDDQDDAGRALSCDVAVDVATHDVTLRPDEELQIQYLDGPAVERVGGELRFVPDITDRKGDPMMLDEPKALADTDLIAASVVHHTEG
ncbi:hypothetical protein [Stackebrandtia nassauensis]|uniref:Lipoprotein n=1 Tax=Stackebrandtia nassauensis (strain DSM 44728 / CIP 108903 / NRRL B-16338 / NBRC 102104 / LLR-40K-21) TaxID=446470 RepID=D3Q8E1_STANL|nr:hypothetical protein [Stackebrandtia nassauensis]ADD42515.1 hypothetical protein Snas_2839 [Stackebrandtia nassauensis DSM 44728]